MCYASHTADVETMIHGPQLHQTQRADQDSCFWKCTLSARISCTKCKWILGWVVPCEIVCEMHVAQMLQTLSSLTAEHTNSFVLGWPFSKLVASSGGTQQQKSPGSFEMKLWMFFFIDWCRCEVLSMPHLFSISFWKCKILLCSPCISFQFRTFFVVFSLCKLIQ
jgi:hypothetical protein